MHVKNFKLKIRNPNLNFVKEQCIKDNEKIYSYKVRIMLEVPNITSFEAKGEH